MSKVTIAHGIELLVSCREGRWVVQVGGLRVQAPTREAAIAKATAWAAARPLTIGAVSL